MTTITELKRELSNLESKIAESILQIEHKYEVQFDRIELIVLPYQTMGESHEKTRVTDVKVRVRI